MSNPTDQPAGVPGDAGPFAPRLGTAHRRGPEHSSVTSAAPGRAALAVEARGVRKSFGDQVVLDGIDLDVVEGSVFALLGPNGSGKTTTVRILSTLLAADSGVIRVAGHEMGREADLLRAAIGVTGQFSAVDKLLTGQENLMMMADLAHLSRADGRRRAAELLGRFDLSEAAGKMAATYSGGMSRRLDLAMTLVGAPRIVFLDEPTTGLDPRGRHVMWQIIRGLAADGVTILLTTQDLEEADQLADRVAVLDHGALVAEGSPALLKARIPGGHIRLQFTDPQGLETAARLLTSAGRDDETLCLQVPGDGSVPALRALLDQLDQHAIDVDSLSIHTPDLDDVFFAVTGHPTASEDTQR